MDNPPKNQPSDVPDGQLEKVPEDLPASRAEKRTAAVVREEKSYSFVGPIPPPGLLAAYDKIIPNGANRILSMAEAQQSHRQHLEKTVVESDTARANLGLVCGFIVAMALVIGSIYLIDNGHTVEGLSGILLNAVALVCSFVYAQNARKSERLARSKNATEPEVLPSPSQPPREPKPAFQAPRDTGAAG